jgi:hypothetical protein
VPWSQFAANVQGAPAPAPIWLVWPFGQLPTTE